MAVLTKVLRSIKPSSAALFHGIGNSASYFQWGEANKNGFEYRFTSVATSGDSRGIYLRLKLNSTGSGEALRVYTNADASGVATGGTANGAHITLAVGASGTISGQANAMRVTLDLAAATRTVSGNLAVTTLESNIGANNTIPNTVAFIRLVDLTAVKIDHFLRVPAASNSTIFATHTTEAMSHSIRIISDAGTPYYIMCASAATNRGGGS